MWLIRLLLCCALAECSYSCSDQDHLLPNPAVPSERGPYSVGSILGSVMVTDTKQHVNRRILVEAWYPAVPGSEAGKPAFGYDIREHVPPKQRKMLATAANDTFQPCDCFRGLPVANGSFPVLLYIHGTAAFRTESLHQQTHWASRGFIVLAADHPGIQLYDLLGEADGIIPPRTNQEADGRAILAALAPSPFSESWLAPLQGHVDMNRVGALGHSAGGFAVDKLGDVADVLVPMAGLAPDAVASRAKSTLVLAARNDTIVGYDRELAAFKDLSAAPRRFASVDALGHLFCSDLCFIGASAGGIVQIAIDHGIEVAKLFKSLGQNGCAYLNGPTGTHYLEPSCGWQFVNYATAAALEETLRCDPSMQARLTEMKTHMPIPHGCPKDMVFDYQEKLDFIVAV